jgi:hypothetical protein
MVHGYHIVFGAYGFWLPNDPRGSGSSFVRSHHLHPFGEATKVRTRQSVANAVHDRTLRLAAKGALKYPAVRFTGLQARAVARGIANLLIELDLHCYACAIMPDHVHLVIGRHDMAIDRMAGFLKRAGTRGLNAEKLHPFEGISRRSGRVPSPWAGGQWCVFLNSPQEMWGRIRYVEGIS